MEVNRSRALAPETVKKSLSVRIAMLQLCSEVALTARSVADRVIDDVNKASSWAVIPVRDDAAFPADARNDAIAGRELALRSLVFSSCVGRLFFQWMLRSHANLLSVAYAAAWSLNKSKLPFCARARLIAAWL